MIRREPAEVGGEYFRILPEGRLEGYDGFTLKVKKPKQGIDLNRNFPGNWRQEHEAARRGTVPDIRARGAGSGKSHHRPSEHLGGVAFHTWSGVLAAALRPFARHRDARGGPCGISRKSAPRAPNWTGYPNISVYHEFRYHPKQVIGGAFDWIYDHLGMFSWVVEIWEPDARSGDRQSVLFIDWFRDHPTDDDLKIFRWSEEKLGGAAHVDWKPFEHPELGTIEIGGWNRFHAFGNPPLQLLEREVAKFPKRLVWQALLSPKLELVAATSSAIGQGVWSVQLVVQNTGWLPSYVSKRAQERKVVRDVLAGDLDSPTAPSSSAANAAKAWGNSRQSVQAHRDFVLAGLPRNG